MAIVNRITRLFTADVHAVLDRLEEPDALLRQAIREMETVLAEQALKLKRLETDREQQRRRRAEIQRALASIAEELDLSFAAGNAALVRKSLRRRLEGERLVKMLDARLQGLDAQIEQLAPALAEHRERLEGMRQKAALFSVEPAACGVSDAARWSCDDFCVSEADVDLALLREQQARRTS